MLKDMDRSEHLGDWSQVLSAGGGDFAAHLIAIAAAPRHAIFTMRKLS
jgi:hypothetical protein